MAELTPPGPIPPGLEDVELELDLGDIPPDMQIEGDWQDDGVRQGPLVPEPDREAPGRRNPGGTRRKSPYWGRIPFVAFEFPQALHFWAKGWAARHPQVQVDNEHIVDTSSLDEGTVVAMYVADMAARDLLAEEARPEEDKQYDFGDYFYHSVPFMIREAMTREAQANYAAASQVHKQTLKKALLNALKSGPLDPSRLDEYLGIGEEEE